MQGCARAHTGTSVQIKRIEAARAHLGGGAIRACATAGITWFALPVRRVAIETLSTIEDATII